MTFLTKINNMTPDNKWRKEFTDQQVKITMEKSQGL